MTKVHPVVSFESTILLTSKTFYFLEKSLIFFAHFCCKGKIKKKTIFIENPNKIILGNCQQQQHMIAHTFYSPFFVILLTPPLHNQF